MKKQEKTIGILGGMGPEATVRLFHLIVTNTRAETDVEHVPVLIVNDPKIPDRSAYIHGQGPSPVPAMEKGMYKLEKLGADFITIPCNTAHFFLPQISNRITIPVIHLVNETARWALNELKGIRKFGLLSTTGAYKTGIYTTGFEQFRLEIIVPDFPYRERIMQAIYAEKGIKAGYKDEPLSILLESVEHLSGKGVEAIICGCTEISLVLTTELLKLPLLDPLLILAQKSISLAGYELKR